MDVVLLTQENCGFCVEAKAMLDRLAREFPLAISTVDLGTDAGQELAERGGIWFPPGVFIDGEPFAYGRPSERALRREIGRRLATARTA